ncbi:peptidoglycan DD-metalloendopeptidase family protein [Bdellovibrio bacteriovorus]|nr:peptidoglycan DD-metalloendopeptidase family protein [Bdellovibrio bacteriovorus]
MRKLLSIFIIPLLFGVLGMIPQAQAAIEAGDPFLIDAPRGINVRKKPNAKRIGAIPNGHTVFATGPARLHSTGRAGKQYWLPIRYQNESNEWRNGWIYMRYATSSDTTENRATVVKSAETDGVEQALQQRPTFIMERMYPEIESMRLTVNVNTRARLRASPSFQGRILDGIPNDAEVQVIGQPSGQWVPVRVTATGQKGWMHVTGLENEGSLNPLELADRNPVSANDAKKEIDEYAQQVKTEGRAEEVCTTCQNQGQLQKLPVGKTGYSFPVNAAIRSRFGGRKDPFTGRTSNHGGVDFAVRSGTSVGAIRSGTVVQVKNSCRTGDKRCGGGWGNHVIVDHGNGVRSVYAHLSSANVRVGSHVGLGTTIGKSGSTGRSTGPHLHLEMHVNGTKVNPLKYISK